MKHGQAAAAVLTVAGALAACGPKPLTLDEFAAQRFRLECIGAACPQELGLLLEGGIPADKRCELEDDVRATQDGRPMKQLSPGRFVPTFLWGEDWCDPARWELVDTQPREVTTFEISDGISTVFMQLRLAFDARSAELVPPAAGYFRDGDTAELHWSPAEDRLNGARGIVGPDDAADLKVNFEPVEGGVYKGTVNVIATHPASGEFRVRALRSENSLVISCQGVARCDYWWFSDLSLGTVEMRP